MKRLILPGLVLFSSLANAQAPTWADDGVYCVQPLYQLPPCWRHQRRGVGCITYSAAFYAREDMAGYTAQRVMPPQPPDPNYRRLA
ncbi:MAG: hypothetical protein IPP33_19390 [Flavobacteriales bacterium]|nr:hypothetical protein [Flavobacteriales bacterium]